MGEKKTRESRKRKLFWWHYLSKLEEWSANGVEYYEVDPELRPEDVGRQGILESGSRWKRVTAELLEIDTRSMPRCDTVWMLKSEIRYNPVWRLYWYFLKVGSDSRGYMISIIKKLRMNTSKSRSKPNK